MSEPYDFSKASSDLHKLLIEVEKYKEYISKQTSDEWCLKCNDIISCNNLTMFGAEIFQFWLAAIRVGKEDISEFLTFAKSVSVPVKNRDLGPEGLSWLGKSIYDIWCEAIRVNNP